jgi:hypothetical protein
LQQAALGVAADRAEREEDGQHHAEEERDEHRQAEQRPARQRPFVDRDEAPAARPLE